MKSSGTLSRKISEERSLDWSVTDIVPKQDIDLVNTDKPLLIITTKEGIEKLQERWPGNWQQIGEGYKQQIYYREAEETAESDAVLPAAKTARPAKKGSLLLYILLAIPVTALCLGLLLAAALLFTGLSAAGFAYGAIGLSVLLHTYTALADKLVATGLSMSAFALALLMLWLVFRTVFGAMPSLIRAVASRGRKWCGEEVEE